MTRLVLTGATLAVLALTGCAGQSASSSAGSGDCAPRVRFHNTVYEIPTTVNQDAALGNPTGEGEVLDCDGKVVDSANLRAVQGVSESVAVAVDGGDYHGVYVSRDVPEASWPPQVKASQ